MNEMQVFQNSEFGELGVLEIEGKPYFPAKAAAKMLGYKDTINAIKQHCKGVVKHHLPTKGGMQTLNFIPEGDLYRLITHSKLPAAERFEKWVFDEVLPSIRQTGGYGSQMGMMNKMLEQLAGVTATLLQVATAMTEAKQGQDAIEPDPMPNRRPTSVISRLDVNTRQEVEAMICSGQFTYSEIARHLADCGIRISTTSVWRYAQALHI